MPPLNSESRRNLEKFTHLKLDNNKVVTNSKDEKISRNILDSQIHSFDPEHHSMPKYNDKYINGQNANAIRHLLGGRRGGTN